MFSACTRRMLTVLLVKGKGRKGGKGRDTASKDRGDAWRTDVDVVDKADMHNERFETYYKAQNILGEDEWDSFLERMREPLPTTFRVTGSRQVAQLLNDMIRETHAPQLASVVFEGEAVSPPKQIPWHLNVAKKVLRKSPEFKRFQNFLVFETEVGNISRQEAVSMLPPLFLEVKPHHRVMDMCAAPGSKTAQLLEALHAQDTVTASSFPSGLLIANDSDYKRTHMLIHQAARLPSPSLMVTNHDASIFPAIKIPSEQLTFPAGTKDRVVNKRQHQLFFDRILCDVPCSGDGTMRKNLGIWKHWSPMDGNGLHGLQLRILQRAMRMLQKGGRIVYSTCSINPVENEAVVAAALQSIPGFELIDMSTHLPGLIFRSGIKTWTPALDRSEYIESLPENKRADSKLVESHWPPSLAEADALHLEYCMRIYPHLQDTGGFFVAVLQKKQSPAPARQIPDNKRQADAVEDLETSEVKKPKLSAEDDAEVTEAETLDTMPESPSEPALVTEASAPEHATDTKGKGQAVKGADVHFKENPFTFLKPDDPVILACISQLNLEPDFPAANMLIRNPTGDTVRSIYMTNDIVKQIAENNDYTRMRLMTCGTKVMAKQEGAAAKRDNAEMQFRILSEGLPVMLPYVQPASILSADLATLTVMMETYYPVVSQFQEPFRSAIEPRGQGCYIVRFAQGGLGTASCVHGSCARVLCSHKLTARVFYRLTHDLVLPIWKSNVSVTLMIEKKAKSALSLRVFGEDITTAAREAAQKRRDEQAKSQATVGEASLVEADVIHEGNEGQEGESMCTGEQ
ncbi:uncharacterized protein PHACADRAFT_172372 [Phanerochaete carnosa HHB-10118-sp]|uniref:SAM-dependent MTase RsmB/NOP-type domain-containing protein n=1 Tax=Phanerochaete carnosa (strain HHB-10118-sp) TaxID=650164 RepID=K5WBW0_PHACS|nr:uncharacterized protein PHACADRAFT_172372 [Phanerochaete carnosa HHB-10118-sp]EKM56700.1 hypothetical protein PHACADRAFT_172372 [Phanerochaete carnosa HHB-10118-sp]